METSRKHKTARNTRKSGSKQHRPSHAQQQPKQFPRKLRSFTELIRIGKKNISFSPAVWGMGLVGVLSLVLLILLVFLTTDVVTNLRKQQRISQSRQALSGSLIFWQSVVKKHPDYRDAYLQLALLSYQLGEYRDAKTYTEKSLALDPNYEQGRAMEKILRNF